jgi:hypothetical protein
MPPLESSPIQVISRLKSAGEAASDQPDQGEMEASQRLALYHRMAEFANQPRFKILSDVILRVGYRTPNAVYKAEGQDTVNEYTRAWLEYGPYDNVSIHTDRATLTDAQRSDFKYEPIEGSEVNHFTLSQIRKNTSPTDVSGINFCSSSYSKDMSPVEFLSLWADANQTLDLIDAADELSASDHSGEVLFTRTIDA